MIFFRLVLYIVLIRVNARKLQARCGMKSKKQGVESGR